MNIETGVAGTNDARTADERWAAWVLKGAEHDRTTRGRAIAAAAIAASGLALWLAIALRAG